MDVFEQIYVWFMTLGDHYGVNPVIFGVIYIGAIPFFGLSIAWLVRNHRKGLSILLPAISALIFFISAYLYLMIAGENVPWWVYGIVVAMLMYGVWSAYMKVRKKIETEVEMNNG